MQVLKPIKNLPHGLNFVFRSFLSHLPPWFMGAIEPFMAPAKEVMDLTKSGPGDKMVPDELF